MSIPNTPFQRGTRQLQIREMKGCALAVVDKVTQELLHGVTHVEVKQEINIVTGEYTAKATIIIEITDEDDIWPVEIVEGSVSSLLPAIVRM